MNTLKVVLMSAFAAVFLIWSAGCSVARDYQIADGTIRNRSYSSVAGDIGIGSDSKIRNARTVAGDIDARRGSTVGNLSTVAGSIRLEQDVRVRGSVKTVAGDVDLAPGCVVEGNVGTVAGSLRVDGSRIEGDVRLTVGELQLEGSEVEGKILVSDASEGDISEDDADIAEIVIGTNSEVGRIVAKDGARVHLRIHRSARVGSVEGVEAEYFD